MKSGGLVPLVRLLASPYEDVQLEATRVIANVSFLGAHSCSALAAP